jgi:hypothetical protein
VSQASNPRLAPGPWWVSWHALVCAMACQNELVPHKFFFGPCHLPKVCSQVHYKTFGRCPKLQIQGWLRGLGGCHGMPWHTPWHAKTSWCRTNFFLARAICPKCVPKFIIRHLEGVPSFKSKVGSGALVCAMACLGVCHGMPKRVGAAQIFFWPVPFAQSVFLSSL